MIERIKQATNTGAAMTISAGETKSRMMPKIGQRNDQKEGFQSFVLEATGVRGGPSMQAPSNLASFSRFIISQKIDGKGIGPLRRFPLFEGKSFRIGDGFLKVLANLPETRKHKASRKHSL
jgi:hypothetical protein